MIEQSEMVARDAAGNEMRMGWSRLSAPSSRQPPADPRQSHDLNPLAHDPSDGATFREVSSFTVDMVLGWFENACEAVASFFLGVLRVVVMVLIWPPAREVGCLLLVPSCYVLAIAARDVATATMAAGLRMHRCSRVLAPSLASVEQRLAITRKDAAP